MLIDLDPLAAYMAARHLTAACFAIAAIACVAARRWLLAGLMVLGAFDSYTLWRFDLHLWGRDIVAALFPGHDPFTLQTWALAAAGFAALVLFGVLARSWRGATAGAIIVWAGCAAMLAMFGLELISREDMEGSIYQRIGPFAIFTWWIGISALVIAVGCWIETGERKRLRRRNRR